MRHHLMFRHSPLADAVEAGQAPLQPADSALRDASAVAADDASAEHSPATPHALWLPRGYESKYAYPLVLWLHDDGQSEQAVHDWMPAISDRNYLGVGVRGCHPAPSRSLDGFGWSRSGSGLELLVDRLYMTIAEVGTRFHLNPDRIFLGGQGHGALAALNLLLLQDSLWAGAVAIDLPEMSTPPRITKLPLPAGQRLLVAATRPPQPTPERVHRLLAGIHAAGCDVAVHTPIEPRAKVGLAVDRWIMQSIHSSVHA